METENRKCYNDLYKGKYTHYYQKGESAMKVACARKLPALLLMLALVLALFPAGLFPARAAEPARENVFTAIDALVDRGLAERAAASSLPMSGKAASVPTEADYAALSGDVAALVQTRADYLPGSLERREGGLVLWRDRAGRAYGYSPALRASMARADAAPQPEGGETADYAACEPFSVSFAPAEEEPVLTLMGDNVPASRDAAIFMPYYNLQIQWQFSDFFELSQLTEATGGVCSWYPNASAHIDALARALESCAIVQISTHGLPGAVCLADTGQLTAEDMEDYHAYFTDSQTDENGVTFDIAVVDGRAITNHMTRNAPNSLVWLHSCSVLQNDQMWRPLRERGVGVVFGWSRILYEGETREQFEVYRVLREGGTLPEAAAAMRRQLWYITSLRLGLMGYDEASRAAFDALGEVYWNVFNPALPLTAEEARENDAAFMIFVSADDPYPDEAHLDEAHPVNSNWRLPLSDASSGVLKNVLRVDVQMSIPLGAAKTVSLESGVLPPGMEATADLGLHGDYWGTYAYVRGKPTTPGYYESTVKLGLENGGTKTLQLRILVTDRETVVTEENMELTPGFAVMRYFEKNLVPESGYAGVELLSGTLPAGMTLIWKENVRPALAGKPSEGTYAPTFRFLMKDGRVIQHTVHVFVPSEEISDGGSFVTRVGKDAELPILLPEGETLAEMALVNGTLPPGMKWTYHPDEGEPKIYGKPMTEGTYTAVFKLGTAGGKLITYTARVRVYGSSSYLDLFTVNLSEGPCRVLMAQDKEHLETSLTAAAAAGLITMNTEASGKRLLDLDRDGSWDVEEAWDSGRNAVFTRLETCSVTGDGLAFTLPDDTVQALIAGGATNLFALTVEFRLVNYYDLYIGGKRLSSLNRRDPLGDGTFSYDGGRVLTVDGWSEGTNFEPLIRSELKGLEIRVKGDSQLSAHGAPVVELAADAVVTGPGSLRLTGDSGAAILCKNGAALTLFELSLSASAGMYALQGAESGEKLELRHADLVLQGGSRAVSGFTSTQLVQCFVREPVAGDIGAQAVRVEAYETRYDLAVAGVMVTNRNREDILGDGVFSYDGDKTFTVNGDCTADRVVLQSYVEGMTIRVVGPSRLETTAARNALDLRADTVITGGPLTLVSNKAAVVLVQNNSVLTLREADVTVSGKRGLTGMGSTRSDKLILDRANLTVTETASGAAGGFADGIELNFCEFVSPAGASVTSGTVMDGAAPAKSLRVEAYEVYSLVVDGVQVHDHNMTDVLGNGVFSFDGDRTLTVKGSYTGTTDKPVVETSLPGLILYTDGEASLTSSGGQTAVLIRADAAFTGGHLTLSNSGEEKLYLWNDAELTLDHMSLTVTGSGWGVSGLGDERLIIDGSTVDIDVDAMALFGVKGGLVLRDCAIVYPADAIVSGGNVLHNDPSDNYYYGSLVQKLRIEPRENATHTVSGRLMSWGEDPYQYIRLYRPETPDAEIMEQWRSGQYWTQEVLSIPAAGAYETLTVDGKEMTVRAFAFEGVPDGTYKIAVEQFGGYSRYAPLFGEITVSGGDLALGDVRLWLYGDVTGDGQVSASDVLQLNRHITGLPSVFDAGTALDRAGRLRAANVTGHKGADEDVNAADALQLNRFIAGLSSVFDAM